MLSITTLELPTRGMLRLPLFLRHYEQKVRTWTHYGCRVYDRCRNLDRPHIWQGGLLPSIHAAIDTKLGRVQELAQAMATEVGGIQSMYTLAESRISGVVDFMDEEAVTSARAYQQLLSTRPSANQ